MFELKYLLLWVLLLSTCWKCYQKCFRSTRSPFLNFQRTKNQIHTMFCLKYRHVVHKTMPHVQNEAITLLILKTDSAVLQNLGLCFLSVPWHDSQFTPGWSLNKANWNTQECYRPAAETGICSTAISATGTMCTWSVFPFSGLTETMHPTDSMLVFVGIVRYREVCMPAPACLCPSVLY